MVAAPLESAPSSSDTAGNVVLDKQPIVDLSTLPPPPSTLSVPVTKRTNDGSDALSGRTPSPPASILHRDEEQTTDAETDMLEHEQGDFVKTHRELDGASHSSHSSLTHTDISEASSHEPVTLSSFIRRNLSVNKGTVDGAADDLESPIELEPGHSILDIQNAEVGSALDGEVRSTESQAEGNIDMNVPPDITQPVDEDAFDDIVSSYADSDERGGDEEASTASDISRHEPAVEHEPVSKPVFHDLVEELESLSQGGMEQSTDDIPATMQVLESMSPSSSIDDYESPLAEPQTVSVMEMDYKEHDPESTSVASDPAATHQPKSIPTAMEPEGGARASLVLPPGHVQRKVQYFQETLTIQQTPPPSKLEEEKVLPRTSSSEDLPLALETEIVEDDAIETDAGAEENDVARDRELEPAVVDAEEPVDSDVSARVPGEWAAASTPHIEDEDEEHQQAAEQHEDSLSVREEDTTPDATDEDQAQEPQQQPDLSLEEALDITMMYLHQLDRSRNRKRTSILSSPPKSPVSSTQALLAASFSDFDSIQMPDATFPALFTLSSASRSGSLRSLKRVASATSEKMKAKANEDSSEADLKIEASRLAEGEGSESSEESESEDGEGAAEESESIKENMDETSSDDGESSTSSQSSEEEVLESDTRKPDPGAAESKKGPADGYDVASRDGRGEAEQVATRRKSSLKRHSSRRSALNTIEEKVMDEAQRQAASSSLPRQIRFAENTPPVVHEAEPERKLSWFRKLTSKRRKASNKLTQPQVHEENSKAKRKWFGWTKVFAKMFKKRKDGSEGIVDAGAEVGGSNGEEGYGSMTRGYATATHEFDSAQSTVPSHPSSDRPTRNKHRRSVRSSRSSRRDASSLPYPASEPGTTGQPSSLDRPATMSSRRNSGKASSRASSGHTSAREKSRSLNRRRSQHLTKIKTDGHLTDIPEDQRGSPSGTSEKTDEFGTTSRSSVAGRSDHRSTRHTNTMSTFRTSSNADVNGTPTTSDSSADESDGDSFEVSSVQSSIADIERLFQLPPLSLPPVSLNTTLLPLLRLTHSLHRSGSTSSVGGPSSSNASIRSDLVGHINRMCSSSKSSFLHSDWKRMYFDLCVLGLSLEDIGEKYGLNWDPVFENAGSAPTTTANSENTGEAVVRFEQDGEATAPQMTDTTQPDVVPSSATTESSVVVETPWRQAMENVSAPSAAPHEGESAVTGDSSNAVSSEPMEDGASSTAVNTNHEDESKEMVADESGAVGADSDEEPLKAILERSGTDATIVVATSATDDAEDADDAKTKPIVPKPPEQVESEDHVVEQKERAIRSDSPTTPFHVDEDSKLVLSYIQLLGDS
ncbi:hypothetical protein HK102_005367 [Quaeritorhiza haematococci]|nr:hypothetical protein HK102_005367 [Quaeritorhiza haematococci]